MLSFSTKKLVSNSIMKSQDEHGSWMLGDTMIWYLLTITLGQYVDHYKSVCGLHVD